MADQPATGGGFLSRLFGGAPKAPRNDEELVARARAALRSYEQLRQIDLESIAISAHDGVVELSGNVRSLVNKHVAETLASSIPGLRGVRNLLVADADLCVEVARRLADDPLTNGAGIEVKAYHGMVELLGVVPGDEVSRRAEVVARTATSGVIANNLLVEPGHKTPLQLVREASPRREEAPTHVSAPPAHTAPASRPPGAGEGEIKVAVRDPQPPLTPAPAD